MYQNIITRIVSLFLVIAFVSSCSTAKVASVADQPNKVKELANSLLWKIDGNDLSEPSYLYGTIHIIDEADFFYPVGTLSAIAKTEKVVFEIDMAEMSDLSNAMAMMQKTFMDDGKTLKDVMSPENFKIVEGHFKKMGLPLMLFQRMKPMFLTIFASGDINPGDIQSGKMKSYEMEFAKVAKEKSLPTAGLETIDFQIGIFDQIPYEDQATMLVESIVSSDSGSDQFKMMVDIYKKQNISKMQTMMKGDETIEEYEDILLVGRNKNWIPIMKTMMAENPTFFAVGAGHLGGDMGVIKLLMKEGFKVTPVISI